jgi:hypothetical protein
MWRGRYYLSAADNPNQEEYQQQNICTIPSREVHELLRNLDGTVFPN